MSETQLDILKQLSAFYKDGNKSGQYNFNQMSNAEKRKFLIDVDYLKDKGYITTNKAIGFVVVTLTAMGIDYITDNFSS